MRKIFLTGIIFYFAFITLCYGQAGSQQTKGVTCPATGSAIKVIDTNPKRMSYSLINDSATDVRVSTTITASTTLDDTNSYILKAGQPFADSIPGTYFGQVWCGSTTGSGVAIHYTEAQR